MTSVASVVLPVPLSGTNLRAGASVTIGGVAATAVTVVSSTSLSLVSPAHAPGSADVVIKNADGTSVTATAAFTYLANPVPSVASTSPGTVGAGSSSTILSISGSGYLPQSAVGWDGAALLSQYVSPTQLTATVPSGLLAGAELARLTVTNPSPGGGASDLGPVFSSAPVMSAPRWGHTATVLSDGRILVCGGQDGLLITNSAAIYDPVKNAWVPVSNMQVGRVRHTATLLANGKVLITGGTTVVSQSPGFVGYDDLASAELFDPASNSFALVGSMSGVRSGHSATFLQSGKVLIVGGKSPATTVASTEIFDPASNTFTVGPATASYRAGHSAVALKDGSVAVMGGYDEATFRYPTAVELYSPSNNSFSTVAQLSTGRSRTAAVLLSDGRIFVAGGINDVGVSSTTEIYNPTTRSVAAGPQLNVPVYTLNAVVLGDGKVLLTAGQDTIQSYAIASIYDPAKNSLTMLPSMNTARHFAQSVALASGGALVIGGLTGTDTGSNPALASSEIYSPAAIAANFTVPVLNPAPTLTSVSPATTLAGYEVTFSGTGFNKSSAVLVNGNAVPVYDREPTQVSVVLPKIMGSTRSTY